MGISFNYLANGKTNLIQDYIESSKLYVYNRETEELIQSFQVKREMLQSTNSFSIKLPTGDYTVVAVGNASDRTSIKYVSYLHNARVASPEYHKKQGLKSNDALYIARKDLTVDSNEKETHLILDFKSAHIKFDVHVRGLSSIPSFRVENLIPEVDFNNDETHAPNKTYSPPMFANDQHNTFQARFNTLRIHLDHEVLIHFTPKSTAHAYTLNLNKFLAQKLPKVSLAQQEILIPILVNYDAVEITAEVPNWVTVPIVPGVE